MHLISETKLFTYFLGSLYIHVYVENNSFLITVERLRMQWDVQDFSNIASRFLECENPFLQISLTCPLKLLSSNMRYEMCELKALSWFWRICRFRWIRGEHFRYKFTRPGSSSAAQGKWWVRKRIGPYFPAVNLDSLRSYFQSRNWPLPGSY